MNRVHAILNRSLTTLFVIGVLLMAGLTPSRSDTPWLPIPKLPPPPSAVIAADGTIYYADGSILYPTGVYVLPDGTWYVIF